VADLGKMPGVLEQVKLVAGLRWRMLRNGLRRKNSRWDLIAMVWAGIFSGLLVIGLAVAFYAGTVAFLRTNRVSWLALLFWAIFIWWQAFPIFEAGFGTTFEFRNLLRFPMSRRAFYLLGLGYGFADFGAVAGMCWIGAMLLATAATRWELLPAMLGVSLIFVLLNVTLERLLGSWVEKILAKRRTRELFLALFVLSMVSLNFLNPLMQRYGKSLAPKVTEFVSYIAWLPGSLAGAAVAGAAKSDLHHVLVGTAGLFCWLGVLSGLLWQRFTTQYRGEELSESAAPAVVKKRERRRRSSGGELPSFLPGSVAGVVLKEFRYMTRNGFAFLALVLPPFMVMMFTMQFAGKNSMVQFAGKHPMLNEHGLSPEMFFPAIMAYLILILVTPAYNSFAYEGKGIQTYFMAPVSFREVLLGKNLFLVALVTFELSVSIGFLVWRIGWPTTPRFFATVTAAAFGVLGQLAIANWSSLSFPKKMEIGKMKGQRNSGVAVWTAFGVQIVLGGICAVILFAGQWTGSPWLPAVAFTGLTAAALGGYSASLRSMDTLAEKKRELLIETLCR
jgi:ABC-2 type transport system permease protein